MVVAQLTERSLPRPEDLGSNLVITNATFIIQLRSKIHGLFSLLFVFSTANSVHLKLPTSGFEQRSSDSGSERCTNQCAQIWRIFATLPNVKHFWQYFEGFFSTLQTFEPTLANLVCHWATFHCCKWRKNI